MADDDNTRSYRSGAPFPRGGSSSHADGQGQAQGQGADPLAELARLIGQHDPFADIGRGSPKRVEQRPATQQRDPAPEPAPPQLPQLPQPSQSDWRSARASQDRYQEPPADDYSSRDYSDRSYSNYSDQSYQSQDYGTRQSYSDHDYRARDSHLPSGQDAYRDGYSERGYGHASDPNYGEQDGYRAADDPQHMSGQHYDERTPFDSHGGRGHGQTYGEQAYGDQGYGNFTADPQGRYDQGYAQDGADDGSYQDPRYYGQGRPPTGGDDAAYDDAPRSRGRGGIITIVAVLALAMVGTAAAFAYRSYFAGGSGTAPPVIRADVGPNKVVPPTQGDGASSKLQQDRFAASGQGERVVSREEQPIPFGDGAAVRSVTPRVVQPNQGPSGLPSNASSLAPTNGTAGTERPRPVRTVTIRADQATPDPFAQSNGQGNRGVAAAPPPRAPGPTAAPQRTPAPAPAPNTNGPVPLSPAQGDTSPAPSVATRTPPPPSRSVTPPVRNATDNSGHFVQLSAQRSEDEAESSFRAMQAKFPNLLGNREAVIRRKDVNGKGTFFGAQVGPFASREEAIQLCESLKSQGGTCLYQKN